ncbi:hypothetical protein Mapa_005331 [Marchantia paleacea]|nr:hypothetical protein Mapa_005331 [Marchantia paleacea]
MITSCRAEIVAFDRAEVPLGIFTKARTFSSIFICLLGLKLIFLFDQPLSSECFSRFPAPTLAHLRLAGQYGLVKLKWTDRSYNVMAYGL